MEPADRNREGIGARVLRKEDDRFLRGGGCYVGDIALPGLREVAFLRSPLAHARIRSIRKPPGASELAGVTRARSNAGAGHESNPGTGNGNHEVMADPQQSPAARTACADAPMAGRRDAEPASPVRQESAAIAPPEERPTSSQGPAAGGTGQD